jgi:hypothetical protein
MRRPAPHARASTFPSVSEPFHKFPHTPHLSWLGQGEPREDKILTPSEAREFLAGPVVVEEKVDGANCGLSVGPGGRLRAQSRGNFLSSGRCHDQWDPLWPWLAERGGRLAAALGRDRTLYGEWCFAKHTIPYEALPDWFLAFDVFEPATGLFWGCDRRNELLSTVGLKPVPELFRGRLAPNQIESLIGPSRLGASRMEGIYLRRETGDALVSRAKVVGAEFKQQIEQHWTRRALVPNQLQRLSR